MPDHHHFGNTVLKFNAYTKPVSLLLLKEAGHRTYLGVFLTTVLASLVVLVYYSGLISFAIRDNPIAITINSYNENQESFYLSPKNFSVAIAQKGYDLLDSYILEASVGDIDDDLITQDIPLAKCTDFQFDNPSLNSYFDKTDQIWYCIDWSSIKNIILEGGLESSKDRSLQINIKQCTSITQCTYPNQVGSDQFLFKMTSSNADLSNFATPNQIIGKTFRLASLNSFSKSLNIILQPQITQTDNGYVIPDIYFDKTLAIKHYYETISEREKDTLVYSINMSLDQQSFIIQRSYPKVQDYLGNIGGFYEIIFLSCLLLIFPFNNLSYSVSLLNELFNFEQDYEDSKVHPDHHGSGKVKEILQKSVQLEKFNRMSKVSEGDELKKTQILDQISNDITQFFKEQESKLKLHIFDYFGCCQCKKGGKRDLINFSMGKIKHTLDITYIIKKLQEIDKLKLILLNSDQIKLFDYLPKPKLGLHMTAGENEYCSILRPEQTDLEKALEAQKAYQALQDQDDEITPKLVKLLDDDLIALFRLQLNKGVNRFSKKPMHLGDAVKQLMVMNAQEKKNQAKKGKKKKKDQEESSDSDSASQESDK